jgi:predicted RNA-binding Zn-ribbon protein involved in translation (DUF1610 family)
MNKLVCNNCDKPPENPRNLPMPLPKCPAHGEDMILVQPRTYEQRYVGTMYVCPKCNNSVIYISKELRDSIRKRCTNKNCKFKQHDL